MDRVDYSTRVLANVTGAFYRLVLELNVPSLTVYETAAPKAMSDPEFQAAYRKMAEFVDSGYRKMFSVVE